MSRSYPGSIPPPPGEEVDLQHPGDALRTINYVTQGLTLIFVTAFVAIRLHAKRSVFTGNWNMDDCQYPFYKLSYYVCTGRLHHSDSTCLAYVGVLQDTLRATKGLTDRRC